MEKYNIEQLLRDGNAVQFHPLGSSMWPLFVYPKDEAIVVPVEAGRFKRGDVCLYRGLSGNLIIHRVYKRKGNMLYMVGDHQTEIEGPIESKDALGIMTHYIRNGKKHSASNPIYCLLSRIWLLLRPFRKSIITFGSRIKRLF